MRTRIYAFFEEYRLLAKGGNNRLAKWANSRLAALTD